MKNKKGIARELILKSDLSTFEIAKQTGYREEDIANMLLEDSDNVGN